MFSNSGSEGPTVEVMALKPLTVKQDDLWDFATAGPLVSVDAKVRLLFKTPQR